MVHEVEKITVSHLAAMTSKFLRLDVLKLFSFDRTDSKLLGQGLYKGLLGGNGILAKHISGSLQVCHRTNRTVITVPRSS